MKILITGSSGYLGGRTARTALEQGHQVAGLDLKPSGLSHPDFSEVAADITDPEAVRRAAEGCGAVFHLAAALVQFEPDEKRMREVNVDGTANALAAAYEAGAGKFVYVSSVEVYGIDVPTPCPEDAPMSPVCEYGVDKVEGEKMCRAYLETGLDVTILRPPTINGPGQNEPFLVEQMEAISRGKSTLLPGGGRTKLQMVHVEDVADAMFLALDNSRSKGEVLNVCSDDVPTLRELATHLYEHAGTKPRFISINAAVARVAVKTLAKLGVSPIQPQHLEIALRDYVFDNARAKRVLGWRPTRNDLESAVEAYDYYVEHRQA